MKIVSERLWKDMWKTECWPRRRSEHFYLGGDFMRRYLNQLIRDEEWFSRASRVVPSQKNKWAKDKHLWNSLHIQRDANNLAILDSKNNGARRIVMEEDHTWRDLSISDISYSSQAGTAVYKGRMWKNKDQRHVFPPHVFNCDWSSLP
jgi:hypothetical protein